MPITRTWLVFVFACFISGAYVSPGHPQLFSLGVPDYYAYSASSNCRGIALGPEGRVYVAGFTHSPSFPCRDAYQPSLAGGTDAFVACLSSSGGSIISATYLGGEDEDRAFGIGVDDEGNILVAGMTSSGDFPCRGGPGGGEQDAFVVRLSSSGSTVLGGIRLGGRGDDAAFSLALGSGGSVYIGGETFSFDFPTRNPYQAAKNGWEQDVFLACLTYPDLKLNFSTYLGGRGVDLGGNVALGPDGSPYLAGSTWSDDFPTLSGYSPARRGKYDAFICKFVSTGSALIYSTYLGGEGIDFVHDLAVDRRGGALVTGSTLGEGFPEVFPLFNRRDEDGTAFLSRISPDGSSLTFSTCWGTPGGETGLALGLGPGGDIYLAGITGSAYFPLRVPFQLRMGGYGDAFVTKISLDTSAIIYSTYLGGNEMDVPGCLTVDNSERLYVAGFTRSFDFPLQPPRQKTMSSGADGFVSCFSSSGSGLIFSTYLGDSPER